MAGFRSSVEDLEANLPRSSGLRSRLGAALGHHLPGSRGAYVRAVRAFLELRREVEREYGPDAADHLAALEAEAARIGEGFGWVG